MNSTQDSVCTIDSCVHTDDELVDIACSGSLSGLAAHLPIIILRDPTGDNLIASIICNWDPDIIYSTKAVSVIQEYLTKKDEPDFSESDGIELRSQFLESMKRVSEDEVQRRPKQERQKGDMDSSWLAAEPSVNQCADLCFGNSGTSSTKEVSSKDADVSCAEDAK